MKSIAACGPGFADWETLRGHFTAAAPLPADFAPKPQGALLPAVERRRASLTVRLAVDVAQAALQQSGLKAQDVALVFASSNGDTNTIHNICTALATPERFVSPTNFHNSVHNAAAGYWSIGAASMQPSTCLSAREYSVAAGLIEAAAQCATENLPVLLAIFDTPFPEPLHAAMPTRHVFGMALVLDAKPEGSLARLSLTVESAAAPNATRMVNDENLENLRLDSPAARSLPLLAALAAGGATEVTLDYADDLKLKVECHVVMTQTD
ncbi:MAG: beta-ketoacyl synthase chain length factor [Desulfobulbus sp.]|nr:beta-ketoacyl synthase chain length factor [Desulfobulbus sp.]